MARLLEKYQAEIHGKLKERFGFQNDLRVPKITKVVVSMGIGRRGVENRANVETAAKDLTTITGQKAVITIARRSVSGFRLREGMPIGCMTTLRGDRMYEFMDRLISLVLPRIRDFRGIKDNFDGQGNFSLGLSEQTLFPEINLDKVEFHQGLNVTFVTTAQSDEEGRALLESFGMPFRRRGEEQ